MLYNDFKFLNYWKTKHKLSKIEELMTRLLADANIKLGRIDNLISSINIIMDKPDNLDLPDLIVKDIILTDLGSGVYDIAYIVKNIGLNTASTCFGSISYGNDKHVSSIPALNKDSEITIHSTWYYDPESDSVNFDLTATADYYGTVEELREYNNTLTKTFFNKIPLFIPVTTIPVPPPLPPPLPSPLPPPPPASKAYIIVHCHNPEGIEIGGEVFDNFISTGGNTILTGIGTHIINVKFNGMTSSQTVNLINGQILELIFTFPRISFEGNMFPYIFYPAGTKDKDSFYFFPQPTYVASGSLPEYPQEFLRYYIEQNIQYGWSAGTLKFQNTLSNTWSLAFEVPFTSENFKISSVPYWGSYFPLSTIQIINRGI